MTEITYLLDLSEFKKAINVDNLVIVDFTATWCGPCKAIAPMFQTLSIEHPDCDFYKVDVDDGDDIAQECQIKAMPTFNFYKNGILVCSFSGADVNSLKKNIQTYK